MWRLRAVVLLALPAAPAAATVLTIGDSGEITVVAASPPPPRLAAPSQTLQSPPPVLAGALARAAAGAALADELVAAIAWVESRYRSGARSPAGAIGVMQLMPGTARMLGVRNPRDPHANIDGGARYLRRLLDRFGGDVSLALAAYNAGPGRVERAGGIPRIAETQNYVTRILARLASGAAAATVAAQAVVHIASVSGE